MKHLKLALLALFALASCNGIPPTNHHVVDIAISGDFGVGGFDYKADTTGLFASASSNDGESFVSVGRTWMTTGELGTFMGISLGQENTVGFTVGGHYFREKDFVMGLRYNQVADAILLSIGYSF